MKPEPVPSRIDCSACGLPWASHKATRGKVSLSECVRLLREELRRRPNATWTTSGVGATVTNIASGEAKAG